MSSYMVTHAMPEGESKPDTFVLHMEGLKWDGSSGVKLIAPWDGHGMTSTQSHGMEFDGFSAKRLAFPGDDRRKILAGMDPPTGGLFVGGIHRNV